MKKRTFFNFFLTAMTFVILLACVGCGDSPGKVDENAAKIEIKGVEYSKDGVEVRLPEVREMKNESLQKKINENIKNAILALENKGKDSGLSGDFRIMFLNDRLLIVNFSGQNDIPSANGVEYVEQVLHVDLTTGKIFTLADLFKKGAKYEEEILKIAKENSDLRLYDPGANENWQFSTFKTFWDPKNKGQIFALCDEFLWVYTISSDDECFVPGYGIPYDNLSKLIDKEGVLWKAFSGQENRAEDLEEVYMEAPEYETYIKEMEEAAKAEAENDRKKADAARLAADKKKQAAAEKAAYEKGMAAGKASAPKPAPKPAAKPAAQGTMQWRTTKVVRNNDGTLTVHGQYVNNFSNRTMTRVNSATLSFYYKNASGVQKVHTVKYTQPMNKVVSPMGVTSGWFKFRPPADYNRSYIKVTLGFNYSWR